MQQLNFLPQNGEKRDDLEDETNGVKRQRNVSQFVDRGKTQVYNWAEECINIHAKERKNVSKTDQKKGVWSTIMDQESLIHKLLTYGVAVAMLVVCMIIAKNSAEIAPALGTVILVFLLYYAFMSRRILETLIFGAVMGIVLLYGAGGVAGLVDGTQEMFYGVMETDDYVWLLLNCAMLNIVVCLLGKCGATQAFANIIRKHAKDAKHLNLWTWLMQFPMFFDDYMHIMVLGGVMAPIYDREKVPREEGAFIIQTTAEPIRALFPFTGWTAFMAGIFIIDGFVDDYGGGLKAFIHTVPFSFYCWVAIIGSLLLALGVLPKLGVMKHPDPSVYTELEGLAENDNDGKRRGNLFDFFAPIVAIVVLSYFYDWDLVPALIIVLPVQIFYYMLRGIINTADVEECIVEGTKELVYLYILILFSYILGSVLEEIAYTEYLVDIAGGFSVPGLLPFLLFVIFCCSEAAMSLNWSLLLVAFPVIIPLALKIGANPYMCAAALISAGAFGNNFCPVCDFTSLTATSMGLPSGYQSRNCLPYSLIFAGITAVLYLICGFIF